MRKVTLCYLIKNGDRKEILMAMKKRDFGKGFINGFGGKLEGNETLEECLIREGQEEIGIALKDFYEVAILRFTFPHKEEWNQEVHVYFSEVWDGEPVESDELAPQWFDIESLDYSKMWPDDIFWLPKVINGEYVEAKFTFNEEKVIVKQDVKSKKLAVK